MQCKKSEELIVSSTTFDRDKKIIKLWSKVVLEKE